MEAKRRTYQNMLNEKIKGNERMIEMLLRSIESIRNTMSADKDKEYFENRITKTENSIAKYRTEIEELTSRVNGVMSGSCYTEINKLYQDTKDEMTEKEEKAAKREAIAAEKEEKNRIRGKAYEEREKREMRREYGIRRDIEREYNRFLDISENLPDYISKNLKSMPNNKGYKFRGITFYGALPAEHGATVVFEKKPDGMIITEYYSNQEVTYFKPRDGGQKELVRKVKITQNFNAPATRIVM